MGMVRFFRFKLYDIWARYGVTPTREGAQAAQGGGGGNGIANGGG